MFKRIDHTEIIPVDIDRTIKFYTEVLGFTLKERFGLKDRLPMKEIAYLTLGDTMLEVIAVADPKPASKDWQVCYKRIAIEVEDMDKAISFLKSKGVRIAVAPVRLATSFRAEVEDPDGLTIELRQWLR
ncbi:MAG: VOC family protein [Chloroflexi bacterium]|nr:VOC family protein [Chloroflexota bacterium]